MFNLRPFIMSGHGKLLGISLQLIAFRFLSLLDKIRELGDGALPQGGALRPEVGEVCRGDQPQPVALGWRLDRLAINQNKSPNGVRSCQKIHWRQSVGKKFLSPFSFKNLNPFTTWWAGSFLVFCTYTNLCGRCFLYTAYRLFTNYQFCDNLIAVLNFVKIGEKARA